MGSQGNTTEGEQVMGRITKAGQSTTGAPRALRVESVEDGMQFVVIGSDGKKQHAAVVLSQRDAVELAKSILAQANSK